MRNIWIECNDFPKEPLGTFVILVGMVDTKNLSKYICILASFISFLHNRAVGSEYPCGHVHAITISPNDVLRYLNLKAFRTTEPAGDANPI